MIGRIPLDVSSPRTSCGPAQRLIAVLAAVTLLVTIGYGGPRYTDLRTLELIHGDSLAGAHKAAVCLSCHGADGISVAPTFPRLAGQRADYLYHRLQSFKHAKPKDPYYSVSPMTAMAAALSDIDMRDLAAYFASQIPRLPDAPSASPASSATDMTALGERLFLHGDPGRGVPPCQGCHGADANGPGRVDHQYAAYPALRGQYAPYVVARLSHYHEGLPADTSNTFIMQGVAQTLDDDAVQALAAWINSLTPARSF